MNLSLARLLLPTCLLLATTVAPAFAAATKVTEQDIERVTDFAVKMVPFGALMAEAAAKDPEWPLTGKANKVTPVQLACMRTELSEQALRRRKLDEVRAYAAANPDTFLKKTEIMESTSRLFGKLVQAGVDAAKAGVEADPAKAIGDASAADLMRVAEFMSSDNYADLRALVGIDGVLGKGETPEDNKEAGRNVGETMVMKLMISSLETCKIPASAVL